MIIIEKLSSTQKDIFVTQSRNHNSCMYNVGGYARIDGVLDLTVLEDVILKTLNELGLVCADGGTFSAERGFSFMFADHSHSIHADEECRTYMSSDMRKKISLQGALIEVSLLKVSAHVNYWYVKAHHIVMDGYSMSLFFNTVSSSYNAQISGSVATIQLYPFADFVADEISYKVSEEYSKDKIFWQNRLSLIANNNAFSSCMRLVPDNSLTSVRVDHVISRPVFNEIEKFCTEKGCTVFHYFLAVLILLNKLYNNEDAAVGIPVFNRWNKKHKNTLGTFVNIFPFITAFRPENSFSELLQQIKQDLKECYRHQKFPLSNLVEEDTVNSALYNIVFSYQKNTYLPKLGEATCEIKFVHNGEQQEDLKIHLLEYSETEDPVVSFDYKTGRFTKEMATGLISHFERLFLSCMRSSDEKISSVKLLDATELDRILLIFNNTASPYVTAKNVVQLFEERAAAIPSETALVCGNTVLTYAELNTRANRMSHYLLKNYDVHADTIIGVKQERDEWMVITMMAILKSGAAYVPVDVDYPAERIAYLIEDSRCSVLVDAKELDKFREQENNFPEENLNAVIKPGQLAYIIYTSGSTGNPKGVMIEHGNLTAFIHWCSVEFGASDFDTVLAVTSICFDLSVFELFYTLCAGKKIQLLKNGLAVPQHLNISSKILLNTVPSVVGALLREEMDFSTVSVLNMAGEPIPKNYTDHFDADKTELRNLYGPSEDTTYSTCFRIKNNCAISIGRPILNSRVYIVDTFDNLLPPGVSGEICIAGDGLARGYLYKPELTAAKFVPDPFNEGGRMYRTGDEGRWLPDGTIEFLGRRDNQVKIRGYRIELEEIENALRSLEGVKDAVVHPVKDVLGEKTLVAYYTADEGADVSSVKTGMQHMLPAFMQPAHYMQLQELPRTSNGKVDRKKLPVPEFSKMPGNDYMAPETETEQNLVAIWEQLLGRKGIGRRDDFFALGGHSLKTMNLLNRIQLVFDVRLELQLLFKKTILADQALLIMQAKKTHLEQIVPLPVAGNYPLSSSQHRLWIVSLFDGDNSSYNMSAAFTFEGVPDPEILQSAFNYIIERHEILRTSFKEDETAEIKQFIQPQENIDFCISHTDLVHETNKDERLDSMLKAEASKPFDMDIAPLMRTGLIKMNEERFVLTFTMHHIIGDGWSMEVLIRELVQIYNALAEGKSVELQPLNIHFKDYSHWINRQLQSGKLEHQRRYWLDQLKGELSPLKLDYDRLPSASSTFKGRSIHFSLKQALIEKIKALAADYHITEFSIHLAAFKTLLFLCTSAKDILIGMPAAGREHPELEEQLGFYVNVLPLRTAFDKNKTFEEILMTVSESMSAALNNQMYPMDLLIEELKFNREGGRSGFINAGFTWNSNAFERIRMNDELELITLPVENGIVKNDLWIIGTGKNFSIEYRTDLFNSDTIELMTERYCILLEKICENVRLPLDRYELSTIAEKKLESKKIEIEINF